MTNQPRIPAPNYTQVPNLIFDLLADKGAGLTEKELKVLLAIARKTFGWHKKRDKISLSQLEAMTSLSRPSVVAGLEAAIERGIVRRTPDLNDKRGGVFYELIIEDGDQSTPLTSKDFELVNNSNQLKNETRTSKDFEPELVKNLNTQKKPKEKKETPPPTTPHPAHEQAGGGGEITETERLLLDFTPPFSASTAREFAHLPVDAVRAELKAAAAAGSGPGSLVSRWRRVPPKAPVPKAAGPPVLQATKPNLPERAVSGATLLAMAESARRNRA